jgi:hypothetical protein
MMCFNGFLYIMVYDGFLYSEISNVNQAPVMEEENPKEKKPLKSEERNLKFPESFNGGEASNAG